VKARPQRCVEKEKAEPERLGFSIDADSKLSASAAPEIYRLVEAGLRALSSFAKVRREAGAQVMREKIIFVFLIKNLPIKRMGSFRISAFIL
jgi:hypothetical protein